MNQAELLSIVASKLNRRLKVDPMLMRPIVDISYDNDNDSSEIIITTEDQGNRQSWLIRSGAVACLIGDHNEQPVRQFLSGSSPFYLNGFVLKPYHTNDALAVIVDADWVDKDGSPPDIVISVNLNHGQELDSCNLPDGVFFASRDVTGLVDQFVDEDLLELATDEAPETMSGFAMFTPYRLTDKGLSMVIADFRQTAAVGGEADVGSDCQNTS